MSPRSQCERFSSPRPGSGSPARTPEQLPAQTAQPAGRTAWCRWLRGALAAGRPARLPPFRKRLKPAQTSQVPFQGPSGHPQEAMRSASFLSNCKFVLITGFHGNSGGFLSSEQSCKK